MEEHTEKYADMCKEHDALETECQLLKDQMDEADTRLSKICNTSKGIQTEECSLQVSTLLFVTAVLLIEFEITKHMA